jgi:hypothetical protein
VQDGARSRCYQTNRPRKKRERALTLQREKPLSLQSILELKELPLKLPFSIFQETRHDDLESTGLRIDVRTTVHPHGDPLSRLEGKGPSHPCPHNAGELSPLIFNRKIEMPARRYGELRDLPVKKKLRKLLFKGIVDLTSSLGNGKVWVT